MEALRFVHMDYPSLADWVRRDIYLSLRLWRTSPSLDRSAALAPLKEEDVYANFKVVPSHWKNLYTIKSAWPRLVISSYERKFHYIANRKHSQEIVRHCSGSFTQYIVETVPKVKLLYAKEPLDSPLRSEVQSATLV